MSKIKKPTTGKFSLKPYRCKSCGREEEQGTNHWGECYPWCNTCNSPTVWECLEPVPDGYDIPEEWEFIKIGLRIR